ncbi:MAG: cell division/cell wall cluster transcriptional repressor MraZ, partial [Prevotella sp.]|nr:cell division/cell wall cluster transcriptional repressor MraZ [Prevotella sp.]
LVLYPESAWNRQLDMLRQKLNRWDGKKQAMFRQFVIDAELITLDSNGRMLIPKRHLKLAEIEQDVRFIGMDDTIEIWSTKNTEQPFINPEDFKQWLEEVMEDGQGHLQ